MCGLTLVVWAVLALIVVAIGLITGGDSGVVVLSVIGAIILGMVLPVILNFWRPVFFGWRRRRQRLETRLLSDGVLTPADREAGARHVMMWEVAAGTERAVAGTRQEAFLSLEGNTLRLLGDACYTSDHFRIMPSCTGRCSKCWVIWACGGDTFRVRLTVNGEDVEREFLIHCREGRSLRQVAASTEMLEEWLEVAAAAVKAERDKVAGRRAAEERPAEPESLPLPGDEAPSAAEGGADSAPPS